jgi:ATP-dependent RNA circularization protein (DNA/RNA ligase family)
MSGFFRFPHTPHLAWMGPDQPRDDKVLPPREAADLLSGDVVIEEKLDGANLGISLGADGALRVQNRGQYLAQPFSGQFARLSSWLPLHEAALRGHLGRDRILFGEWCAARHSLDYVDLPDWLLVFDVYDQGFGRFWSTVRRDALAEKLGLVIAPRLFSGRTTITRLSSLLQSTPSRFREGPLEGIVVRRENEDWLIQRAKLVRPDFTQAITEHWSRRVMKWNRIKSSDRLPDK